nr:hypothetical protein CFP56_16164 [Quercus suber]POE93852.1 hypothetical protein CFP56_16165 [Quercus suber]POF12032.1 hypothetical protein CFP56_54019 [Quercus suber]
MGDIPGAYTQTFSFEDTMEKDEESNEKVENLCEGLVAVRFSKGFKKQIQTPWMGALIVKVSGSYYNLEALLQIGKAIGNVLRVDTHTANEVRGKFARLCIQVDVDKPLVTAVLIGKFEQPVCYEGIQKLRFSCSKMGHRKEGCPFMVRSDLVLRGAEGMNGRDAEG